MSEAPSRAIPLTVSGASPVLSPTLALSVRITSRRDASASVIAGS